MDTPDRTQIVTPISKFEDSPVFNYINSLSPIKPVKSINIAQTFNSLSFSSPPSVFSSPHLSSQRESRFLKRHFFSGSSKPDLSLEDGLTGNMNEAIPDEVQVPGNPAEPPESSGGGCSIREVTVDPTNENLELALELPRTLKYDCGSPQCNKDSSEGNKTDPMLVVSDLPVTLFQFGENVCVERRLSFQSGAEIHGISQVEPNKEERTECDWESLISDASDLLVLDSSSNAEASRIEDQNTLDIRSSSLKSLTLQEDNAHDMQISESLVQIGSCENHEVDNSAAQSAVDDHKETDHTPDVFSSAFQNNTQADFPTEVVDNKAGSHISFGGKQRGIRRRCLVFDTAGARKRKLEEDSTSSSSVTSQSDGKYTSDDKQLVSIRPCNSTSPCMIPGIGLHLNALAATTRDPRVVKHETLASGKELISMPSSLSSIHSLSVEKKSLSSSLALSSTYTDISPVGNDLQDVLDAPHASVFKVGEDESSPKKKRRKLEQGGESEACKRCNCKKSKCLKLYCECFAAGVYCVEPCSCLECFNKPVHEDTVLATRKQIESRNPLAFAPKVIRSLDSVPEIGEESNKTPASARHKRGCNCKKSNCLKKYCECYQGGVGCSINCRCEGCKNTFGRKDGPSPMGFGEAEQEEEETEAGENNGLDVSLQSKQVRRDEEQCHDHVLPMTFSFQIGRSSMQLPYSSFGKPPRSSLPPQPNFEKHFQIIPEDETPEFLRGNLSPISGIKTGSPNRKRVSPPHRDFVSSPSRRNNRRLVLQSIPSFPSLTQQETSELQ
ncbi:tesmin/TSO1-like CXC [Thalictrum thalictroides]|uniref:Tesmin/TSO1-like CXC n=1 Tax=Thalictrum thalictroides TaxID=46969 RepID=A0A7J6WDI1_THATH|nr:tesmin/TSO1-like CXC [Thalictrum thalictroides]